MTIIVPVDFSFTSQNAALYAMNMLEGHYEARLLLFHVYYLPEEAAKAELTMISMKEKLSKLGNTQIETRIEQGYDFVEALARLARHQSAAAVVMGIHDRSRMEQVFIGSETLKMAGKTVCPVIIVPQDVAFKNICRTALVCDTKSLESGIPTEPVKRILSLFRTTLHLLHVSESSYVNLSEKQLAQCHLLKEVFTSYHPEFYFLTNNQLQDTLLSYIQENEIDLVVYIAHHQSILEKLYMPNTLKQLAFGAPVPVLTAPV
jgi:nucleotide-binding universal stress UspA family protein